LIIKVHLHFQGIKTTYTIASDPVKELKDLLLQIGLKLGKALNPLKFVFRPFLGNENDKNDVLDYSSFGNNKMYDMSLPLKFLNEKEIIA